MNILHYSLGFPPFRRGGMTQYCLDLMQEQAKGGHSVGLLWPGKLKNLDKKSKIKKRNKYVLSEEQSCDSYELVNPLPIPLMDGINNPEMYLIKKDKKIYIEFFTCNHFEVMHIHTFMGLPAELLEAAHEKGVRTVFTSHDYFPICPRCNFFHLGKDCQNDHGCADCVSCNQYGLSLKKMKILQSEFYKIMKENTIVKELREIHNRKMYDVSEQVEEKHIVDSEKKNNYQRFRDKNIKLLESFNVVHFNSSNTLRVYKERGYSGKNAKIITITNGAIKDNKTYRMVNEKIRFGYLGPITTHKGYDLLKDACDLLWLNGQHMFELHVFAQLDNPPPYIICHGAYNYNELPMVMEQFDILVTPSEWEETFGFTVLEALSYGIPVIVSSKVGAKDIIEEGLSGHIIDCDVQMLKGYINNLIEDPSIIENMNRYIVDKFSIKTMTRHANEVEELYTLTSKI